MGGATIGSTTSPPSLKTKTIKRPNLKIKKWSKRKNMNSIKNLLIKIIPSKKGIAKILFVIIFLSSIGLNYLLTKQVYNLRCKVNGQIIGYFVKDIICDEIASTNYEIIELDRQNRNFKEARVNELYE